mgnify:FL=1|tara:strand:+ start:885 stop:1091 length:207 start_codon:yes stop_codon:yes gene_type:complete
MAKITLTYEEDKESGLTYDQTVTITRDGVEYIEDVLDFLAEALKAAGHSYVDRVGYSTDKGETFWSKF